MPPPVLLTGGMLNPELPAIVLGKRIDPSDQSRVQLDGYKLGYVTHETCVGLIPAPKGSVLDAVVYNVTEKERARLMYYAMAVGCLPQHAIVDGNDVILFAFDPDFSPQFVEIKYTSWSHSWAKLACEAAKEIMQHNGLRGALEVREIQQGIILRASARLRAQAAKDRVSQFRGRVDVVDQRLSYADFFALKDYNVQSELFQGGLSLPQKRAVFIGMDAAIVLPYDPHRDRVLLVEQMRMGPLARGEANPWQFEPIAGHIDPGETPEQAAIREAKEEAGLDISNLEMIAQCYPSPGASSEYYYIFSAIADLPDKTETIAGVIDEGENIRSHTLMYATFMKMVETGQITVAPLIAAAYWLAAHRPRLRHEA